MPEKISTPDSLKTPAEQAYMNSLVSAAVKEVFSAMGPLLESIALTPSKLAAAEELRRAPDPVKIARERRERALMKEDLDIARKQVDDRQRACSHRDSNNNWSIGLCRNFPDRQSRGLCMRCNLLISPTHWEIGPPDEQHPRGKPILIQADPRYSIVQEVESRQGI